MKLQYIIYSLLLMAVLCAVSIGVGWQVRGWHDDATTLKAVTKDNAALRQQFGAVVGASNALTDTIAAGNAATDQSVARLVTALGEQSHALTQIRLDIKTLPVGACSFTPAADQLLLRSYQAAFGPASDQAAAPGQAGGGHATHSAARPAHRSQ